MMQIGDLAAQAGVTTRTIRYYEELGIIEPEERTEGGFRLYSDNQVRRLAIVQSLKELGFDLEHIRNLFNLRQSADTGGELARSLVERLDQQQEAIDTKLRHYKEMKERNARAIQVLRGCLCCSIQVFERDCHGCAVYRQHGEVPDLVECAIFDA
ncbi:MAG: MerR family transcriptional regulator [Candidatus Latescibacteria bacterium]|nr:MerR family transcriptional regulator [Candidatus Latescibacterota bacterium]